MPPSLFSFIEQQRNEATKFLPASLLGYFVVKSFTGGDAGAGLLNEEARKPGKKSFMASWIPYQFAGERAGALIFQPRNTRTTRK